jgi:hypothetical protein
VPINVAPSLATAKFLSSFECLRVLLKNVCYCPVHCIYLVPFSPLPEKLVQFVSLFIEQAFTALTEHVTRPRDEFTEGLTSM